MISGQINSDLEAQVSLAVIGPQGAQQQIDFVVDTGYNGFLTIPMGIVDLLSLA
jgi:predicted aspartyl protease